MLTLGACFAGIGGIEHGFEQTGRFSTAWHSEVLSSAGRVLADRLPHAKPLGDVRQLFGGMFDNATPVDVVTGGPPCQGISKANAFGRRGLDDERSALFFAYVTVLRELKPKWVFMEQVLGLLTSTRGRDYETVLELLEGVGYDVEVVAHNSLAYVPQSRARLYFVGCLAAGSASRALLPARDDGACDPRSYRASAWQRPAVTDRRARAFRKTRRARSAEDGEGWVASDYANTLTLNDVGLTRSTHLVVDEHGTRILTPVEWERLHGFPDGWTAAAGADADRYALLGNAVSPPVARVIGDGIASVEGA